MKYSEKSIYKDKLIPSNAKFLLLFLSTPLLIFSEIVRPYLLVLLDTLSQMLSITVIKVNIHRTRSFPGAAIGSGHDLVILTFRVRLKKARKPNQPRLR